MQNCQDETILRPALGQIVSIGQLYNAHTDNFCGASVFRSRIPPSCVESLDAHETSFRYVYSDALSDKFRTIEVSPSLQASIISGLIPINGSALFLNDKKKSARTVTASLLCNISTQVDLLHVFHDDLKPVFSPEALLDGRGTHVVVGISWGANCVLSCKMGDNNAQNTSKVEGQLSILINKLQQSISGKGDVKFNLDKPSSGLNMEIKIFGDILFTLYKNGLPLSLKEGVQMMKGLPSLIKACNEGKGKPLMYRLLPVQVVLDYLGIQTRHEIILRELEDSILLSIVHHFEETRKEVEKLEDFHQDLIKHQSCVTPETLLEIECQKAEVERKETEIKAELKRVLIKARTGQCDAAELSNYLRKLKESEFSPGSVRNLLDSYKSTMEKVAFAKQVAQSGGKYIGHACQYEQLIFSNLDEIIFILFFWDVEGQEGQLNSIKNKQIFLQEMWNQQGHRKCRFYAIDCDFHSELKHPSKNCFIQVQKGAKIISEDFVAEIERDAGLPMAYGKNGSQPVLRKPNKRVPLAIRCTGHTCPTEAEYTWICRECKDELEYGFDQNVYCLCGKTPVLSLVFKCPDPSHNGTFKSHDKPYLFELVSELRPFKELNILIMGETGVGKSTWINAFQNYIEHESLEVAEQNDLLSLIPTRFTVLDDNFEGIEVCTGVDANEVSEKGQSATQECRVYPFRLNKSDTIVRLIDTPGIGDTRGAAQDTRNFENILQTIQMYDEIHGICILLKPNNAKVTIMFKFCIKELLVHLHHEAKDNIVFCFTNSRSTFYRPGDTLDALKFILKENDLDIISKHTMYCFDNEAYRFLAAVKNNPSVPFSEKEKEEFSSSWEKSVGETRRLLEHIKSLKPHMVKSTLSLNNARNIIIKLTSPLADISRNIQINRQIVKEDMEKISQDEDFLKTLEEKRFVKKSRLELCKLEFPQTVCANEGCVTLQEDEGESHLKYKICHDRCRLWRRSEENLTGHFKLRLCSSINLSGNCKNCEHSYTDHVHRFYTSQNVIVEEEDPKIKEIFEEKLPEKAAKELLITAKEKEIEELEREHKILQNASVKFAYFLKTSAITPYNDSMKEYLEHLIREEQHKINLRGGNTAVLLTLMNDLRTYEEKKSALEKAMELEKVNHETQKITPEEVGNIVQSLKDLKHSGKSLGEALQLVSSAAKNVFQATAVVPKPDFRSFQRRKRSKSLRGNVLNRLCNSRVAKI